MNRFASSLFGVSMLAQTVVPAEVNTILSVIERGGALGAVLVLVIYWDRKRAALDIVAAKREEAQDLANAKRDELFAQVIKEQREIQADSEKESIKRYDLLFERFFALAEKNTSVLAEFSRKRSV